MARTREASAHLEPVGVGELARGALRLVRGALPQTVALVAVFVAYGYGVRAMVAVLPPTPATAVLLTVARFVIANVTTALLLRTLLRSGGGLRPDGRLFESAAILAITGMATWLMSAATAPYAEGGDLRVAVGLATTAASLALAYLSFRIVLWPISCGLGREGIGWRRSWALTRGAVLSYFAIILLGSLPLMVGPTVLAAVATSGLRADPHALRQNLALLDEIRRAGAQLLTAVSYILSAAVYDRRVHAADAVADAFT